MHTLPDDLTRLTPEQLLDAYTAGFSEPPQRRATAEYDHWKAKYDALRAELLRRLRLVPTPDTPETVAAKCQAARGVLDLFRGQQERS
jgi:hypothetical protein